MSGAGTLAKLELALQSPDTALLEETLPSLLREYPGKPFTLYANAELLRRRGDARALGASAGAVAALFGPGLASPGGRLGLVELLRASLGLRPQDLATAMPYLQQFGGLLEREGTTHQLSAALGGLRDSITSAPEIARHTPAHAAAVFLLLGFSSTCAEPWGRQVFEELLVPWMHRAAEAGELDTAMVLEAIAFSEHVKRVESQAWFKETTGRWIPGLAAIVGRQARRLGEPHAAWRPEPVCKVGFFIHSASLLAHVTVLLETLQAVHAIGPRDYAFTVFVWAGRHPRMQEAFERCGARVRHLDEDGGGETFARMLRLQRELAEGNFAAFFWISRIQLLAFAFPLRIAPVQGWWAMKYHACEVPEIDAHLAVESVVLRKSMEGISWRTLGNAAASWVDAGLAGEARRLRASFPPGAVVAACIAREEKIHSADFLAAVAQLLRRHPDLVFLWTGRAPHAGIQSAFERAGVADRARFIGWVAPRLYAQAIDLFLDCIPFPCGTTLKEAMAAGKPVVMYRSPESLETGVPGAITPLVEGTAEAPPGARERLCAIFTREADFDLYLCADTPARYVEIASRLVEDPGLRAAAGEANRRYIEAFLSSPADEAAKFLDHLDGFLAALPGRAPRRSMGE